MKLGGISVLPDKPLSIVFVVLIAAVLLGPLVRKQLPRRLAPGGGSGALAAAKTSINATVDEQKGNRAAAFANETNRWWDQYDTEECRRLVDE